MNEDLEPEDDFLDEGPPAELSALFAAAKEDTVSEARVERALVNADVKAPPAKGTLAAKVAEGVVFTIEVDGARTRQIQQSIARLRAAKVNIFGAIVTKHNPQTGYGYGYGYGYGCLPL